MLPTVKELSALLPTLSKPQVTRLIRIVLKKRDGASELSQREANIAYLYEWFLHLGIVNEAQVEQILARGQDHLDATNCVVSIAENRYVHWRSEKSLGSKRFFDLVDEVFSEDMPVPAVTHISCDLRALNRRKQTWLEKLRGTAP